MFLNLWQRALKQPSRRFQHGCNAGRQRKPAFQPRLEILEGRTLPSTVNWIGGSGNWSDDSHWLDAMTGMNHRPTASDDAVIGTGATVTHDSGTDVVQSVTVSSGTLNLTGGALNVSGALSGAGAYRLAGGTLGNATVASGTTITGISGSTLDGVTITGTLDLATAPGVFVYVRNGLTVNGTVQLGDSAGATSGILAFMTTQTVTGSGEIVMGGSTGNTMRLQTSNITVTLDSSLNVHGKNGSFDQFAAIGTTWVNQGTIAADVSGGAITLAGGGTSWTNSNGGFSASSGATVNISSTITNTSSTLTLSGSGRVQLVNGTIIGGTVAGTLTGTNSGGTFDGVTLAGTLDLTSPGGVFAFVRNGLTVNGSVQLGDSAGATSGILAFMTTQTVTGSGEIVMGGSTGNTMRLQTSNITVTLDSSLNVHGKSGSFDQFAAVGTTWVNQGTIAADVSGGNITLAGGGTSWTNSNGGFSASSGATITIGSTMTNTSSTLTLSGSGRVQLLNGAIIGGTVAGALTGIAGGTLDGVTLAGILDLTSPGGVFVYVRNGLTINGSVQLGDSAGATSGILAFMTTQTVSGSGEIVMGGSTGNTMRLQASNITVTLDSSLNVHGKSGSFDQFAAVSTTWVNQGTIAADVSGGTITLQFGPSWTNNGIFRAQNGGTLSMVQPPTNYVGRTLTGGTWQAFANSVLRVPLSSGIVTNAATIVLDGINSSFYRDGSTTDALATFATNDAAGSFTIQDGRNFTTAGDFTNNGTLGVGAGSTFIVNGALTNFSGGTLTGGAYLIGGTLQFNNAAISTNAATIVLDGAAAAIVDESQNDALANLAVNNGSFTIQNGRNFTTGGDFTNNGTLGVGAGSTFTVNGSLTNFSAGTLTGGTYLIGGTFMFNNAAITTNAATTVLDGAGAAAIVDQTGADALAAFATNAVSGSFTIQNGRDFSPAGAFSNAGALIIGAGSTFTASAAFNQTGTLSVLGGGTLNLNGGGTSSGAITNAGTLVVAAGSTFTQSGDLSQNGTLYVQGASILNVSGNLSNAGAVSIDSGSSLTVGGSYTQTDGTTTLTGGTLTAGSLVDIQAGALTGAGTINGNVQNAGLLTIGDSTTVGTLTINGNYSQTSAGTLALKVGGVASFDRLQLTSGHSATLDGTLQVTLINGYTPTTGDSIQIMTFASETGTFATLTGDGPLFTDIYDATDVKLVAN